MPKLLFDGVKRRLEEKLKKPFSRQHVLDVIAKKLPEGGAELVEAVLVPEGKGQPKLALTAWVVDQAVLDHWIAGYPHKPTGRPKKQQATKE